MFGVATSGGRLTGPAGVSGGDMNATFLCWSAVVVFAVVVSMVPLYVLRDRVRVIASGSVRLEFVRVATLKVALLS